MSAQSAPPTSYDRGQVPGKVRGTGLCIVLFVVTFGIYGIYWWWATHEEMKQESGEGLGGVVAALIAFFLAFVMWFLTPSEISNLYKRRGQEPPVSAVTGLWALLLGWFVGLGLIIWFVKTNGALNSYWRSRGAS